MNLTNLRKRFRLHVPSAKVSSVSDDRVDLLLNEGVNEVNLIAQVYKTPNDNPSEFTSVVGKQVYKFSEEITDYLGISKGGVWITDDNGNYFELIPKTKEWFDDHLDNYWDNSNAIPQYYYIDGDDLVFDSPFSAARTVRIYHLKLATDMDNGNNFPWTNTTTEITAFRPLDKAIVAYAVWQIQPSLGKSAQIQQKEIEFNRAIQLGMRRVRRRRDFTSHESTRMTFA